MKTIFGLLLCMLMMGCGSGFQAQNGGGVNPPPDTPQTVKFFPVATAVVSVNSFGEWAALKRKSPTIVALLLPEARAQVQSNGVVSVVYTNPGATSFTLGTSNFMSGSYPQISGDDLLLGNISISSLDDNTLKVCTGVGAPGNKCNTLYIRVFTLGTNVSGSITGIAGFINTDASYGIDVLAGNVATPIGFNSSASASVVSNAANVFTYTIPNNLNRVRLTNTGAITFPMKASLQNAGSGNYEMKLVVQYALGYVP